MKPALWRRSVARYVVPELPGTWSTSGTMLYREPVDWILPCLSMTVGRSGNDFQVSSIVLLLAKPEKYLGGPYLATLRIWDSPATVEDAEPVMRELADLVRGEVLPSFDRLGTVDGYAGDFEPKALDWPGNVHHQELLFCLRLIQGRVDAALEAAEATRRAAEAETRDWAKEVGHRVVRIAEIARRSPEDAVAVLREQADWTRANLKLPPHTPAGP